MVISIVSDVHLKLRRNAGFELNRFELLIRHLKDSPADTIIFNGDLLDVARPTLEEIKALTDAMLSLKGKDIIILGGNHEAVTEQKSTYDFLKLPNVSHSGKTQSLNIEGVSLRLVHWDSIDKIYLMEPSDVLITHYRSKVEGLYEAEVDDSFVTNYGLVLLGDIHQRYSPHKNTFYTSSPYPIHHIRDSREDFGYVNLTLIEGKYSWLYVDLHLPKKIRVDIDYKDLKGFKPTEGHLYKAHVTGTLDELSKVKPMKDVTFTKIVVGSSIVEPQQVKDVDFFESLTTKVDSRLTTKTKRTKSILLKLQGD